LYHDGALTIIKVKCARVVHKIVDETVNDDVARLCVEVVQVTFHDNVFLGLDLGFTTRATSGEVWEESLFVFSNRGMSSSYVGKMST